MCGSHQGDGLKLCWVFQQEKITEDLQVGQKRGGGGADGETCMDLREV